MNKQKYIIKEYPYKGIIRVYSIRWDLQTWCLSNQNIRKNHNCQICGRLILKGKERMLRPLTNLGNRMGRICLNCGIKKEE